MKLTTKFTVTALAAAITSVLAAQGTAVADDDAYKLSESVVTAAGYSQDIKDAPATVSVVTQETLKNRPVRDIGDAVDDLPGVEIEKSKTGSSTIKIRGFGSSYTSILVDGKRQNASNAVISNGFDPNASFLPPLSMIDRIEVIRGPASVLYGSDAIGGVVNIITKKNPSKLSGSLGIETLQQEHDNKYGNAFGYSGSIAIPVIEDKLSLQLRGRDYSKGASNLRYPNGDYAAHSNGDYDLYNYGGRINYTINDNHNVYLDVEHYHEKGSVNSTSKQQYRSQREWDRDNAVLNYDGSLDIGELNAYMQFNRTDRTASARSTGPNDPTLIPEAHTALTDTNYITEAKLVTPFDLQELGSVSLTSGLQFWQERLKNDSLSEVNGTTMIHNQTSAYAEGEYFMNDQWSMTLGARYGYSNYFDSNVTPRAYLIFKPTDMISLKAGVAMGYKTPNLTQMHDGLTSISTGRGGAGDSYIYGNPNLDPEKSVNYELSGIFEHPSVGSLTLTGFYTDFTDQIASTTSYANEMMPNGKKCPIGADSCSTSYNIDESKAYGVELSFKTIPVYGFNLEGSYTYTTNKGDDGSVVEIPRHAITGKLNYNYGDFGAYLKFIGKYRTPISKTSKNSANPNDFYSDIEYFDLGFNYTLMQRHHFALVINNLFDKDFDKYFEYQNRGQTAYVTQYNYYVEGRSIWLSYNMDF